MGGDCVLCFASLLLVMMRARGDEDGCFWEGEVVRRIAVECVARVEWVVGGGSAGSVLFVLPYPPRSFLAGSSCPPPPPPCLSHERARAPPLSTHDQHLLHSNTLSLFLQPTRKKETSAIAAKNRHQFTSIDTLLFFFKRHIHTPTTDAPAARARPTTGHLTAHARSWQPRAVGFQKKQESKKTTRGTLHPRRNKKHHVVC